VGALAREAEETMPKLDQTLALALTDRCTVNAGRVHELAATVTDAEFWQRPFSYGNSFGNLILHLTGNLNYYIGAQIAMTGYVRDRPREFNDSKPPSKDEALKRFDNAVDMVLKTIRAQTPEDWSAEYSGAGSDARNRFEIVMQCAAHMQNHLGQMIYLNYEWQRQVQSRSR